MSEDRRANREVTGITVLKCGREMLEKSVSEVMKERDSNNNCNGYLQHIHGENWELIDVEARNVFEF